MRKQMILALFFLVVGLGMAQASYAYTTTAKKEKTSKKKTDKVYVYGEAMDAFTKGRMSAFITLMKADSTVIDTTTCELWNTNSSFGFFIPKIPGRYLIKAEKEGYETSYTPFDLQPEGNKGWYELPHILLRRKAGDIYKSVDLNGVEVRGTKIQVIHRGDTIIYDASAFNLPDGSMLDALVRQLPGAEIKSNGDIYVNGKKVDYLTLNGRDFFKGDNKVMLDNLPYFTVKNLKVFHRSTEDSRRAGIEKGAKEYVMDVTLKRQYARGYITNTEAGIGTNDRWAARLFGTYYDDHNNATLFGNLNNVNEDRRPGQKGDWDPTKQPKGVLTTKSAGLNIHNEDKEKTVESDLETLLTWTRSDNETHTRQERFAEGTNVQSGSYDREVSDNLEFQVRHNLDLQKLGIYHTVTFNYKQDTSNGERHDSTASVGHVMNRQDQQSHSKYKGYNLLGSLQWYKSMSWGDVVGAAFSYRITRYDPVDRYGKLDSYYPATNSVDNQTIYINNRQSSYLYVANFSYSFALPKQWYLHTLFNYQQDYSNQHNDYYRLDRLPGYASRPMGQLPATEDSLKMAEYTPSSFRTDQLNRTCMAQLILNRNSNGKYYTQFELPVYRVGERLGFTGCGLDTVAHRSYTRFTPNIMWMRIDEKYACARYQVSVDLPEFSKLMPVIITANPLYTTVYNPQLKKRVTHSFSLAYTWKPDSTDFSTLFNLKANIIKGYWGTRISYDSQTLASTTMTDNVDGNWNIQYTSSTEGSFDRKKRLKYELNLDAKYTRSVDFAVAYNQMAALLSRVNTVNTGAEAHLSYTYDKLSAGVNGKFASQHSSSRQADFTTIHVYDFHYGVNLQYTVPLLQMNIFTDLNMFSRRGYQSGEMNTNDLVWNLQLTRSFLKGKLTAKLQAYDLLHQLSNKEYKVDAQGRTEIWYNSVPHYWMLSLAYKFTKTPKK